MFCICFTLKLVASALPPNNFSAKVSGLFFILPRLVFAMMSPANVSVYTLLKAFEYALALS